MWDGSESDGSARSASETGGSEHQGDEDTVGQPAQQAQEAAEAAEAAEEDEEEEAVDLAFMHVAFLPGAVDHWYDSTEGYGGQYGGESEMEGVYDSESGDDDDGGEDDGECDYDAGGGWWKYYSQHEDTSTSVDLKARGPCLGQGGEEGEGQQQEQGQGQGQQRGGYGGPAPRSLVVRVSFTSITSTWDPTANHLEAQYDR